MTKFYKFGRWWFTTKSEAEKETRCGDDIRYDSCQEAYYIRKLRESIWSF